MTDWHQHRPVVWLSISYIVLGNLAQFALDRPSTFRAFSLEFAVVWGALSTLWLARPSARLKPRAPVGGALVFAALVVPFQSTFQGLKQSIGPVAGFPLDPFWAALDAGIHGGPAWHWFRWTFALPWLVRGIDFLYAFGWFAAVLGFLVWCSWTTSPLRHRAVLACLWLWIAGGTVGAWVAASAGPCYSTDSSFAPLLGEIRRLDLYAVHTQAALWGAYVADGTFTFAGISAMPSMHVGMAVLIALVGSREVPAYRWSFWSFATVVQIGSVVTGWHYAIDGYAGAVIAWGAWHLTGRFAAASAPARVTADSRAIVQG